MKRIPAEEERKPFLQPLKNLVIGKAHNVMDPAIFHKLSLIAIFAWIGLGSDALSSSSYGPPEAFATLGVYPNLSIFIGLMVAFTVFIIASSYSQIVELFPRGGGGYIVSSKLLSPVVGAISGCALLIDYVLTITVSTASGADAIFSFLPESWYPYRLIFAVVIVIFLILINLRGAKESVLSLLPIFIIFILTHAFALIYGILRHTSRIPEVIQATRSDVHSSIANLGLFGMLFLILRAYSMGAGTYTGIEAVSNATPILREPRADTAKKTMRYMTWSLIFMVIGLMTCYMIYSVAFQPGKTLNAVLFENISSGWNPTLARGFILITLISEAALLFVASQTGFLDGPRVLANMGADGWVPKRFTSLSDRLVTQRGILMMGIAALILMIVSGGSVKFLLVLYSINVFITFCLSQLGMVRYWLKTRIKGWKKKITVNGIGLVVSTFILISVVVVKFFEGGWITLLILGVLIAITFLIKGHYEKTSKRLKKLDYLVKIAELGTPNPALPICYNEQRSDKHMRPHDKTAVLLVNGFNGYGLQTLASVFSHFGKSFKNFIFIEIGVVEAAVLKGQDEMENLGKEVKSDTEKYVHLVNRFGYYGESKTAVGIDILEEVHKMAPEILKQFPNAVFFAGQLVFPKETFFNKLLHNFTVLSLQEHLFREGIPFIIMPVNA